MGDVVLLRNDTSMKYGYENHGHEVWNLDGIEKLTVA